MSISTVTAQPLDKHRWKDRLILLFAPDRDDDTAREQLKRFRQASAEVEDRDLVIYQINPQRVVYGPAERSVDSPADWFYQKYDVDRDGFAVILIGKDGGEKLRSTELIDPRKIFDLIDTMPMRRAEMRKNGE